jgi:type IV pilus assembly protein PilC
MWILHIANITFFIGFCVLAWKKPGLGLILLPFAMAAMFVSGMIYFEGEIVEEGIVIFLLSIFLFPVTIGLVRWAPSASPLETPWYRSFAIVVITIFQYLLLLAILTGIFHIFGAVLFVLFVVGVVRYKLTRRYTLALDILSAVGMSMRQSLPLPMALNAAAQGQKRRPARIFTDIAMWLTQGWPLSEAIRRGYPKCPPELLASITAAEKIDQLPAAIETLQADIAEKVNDYKRIRPVHPWYPLLVLIVAFFMMMGLAIFIVPTFSEVLSDMSEGQARLPALTQILVDISRFLTGRKGLNAFFVTVLVLTLTVHFVTNGFRRRNPQRPRLTSRLGDWLKWHLPVLHGFEKTYSHLQLIELLKVGLNAGCPVNTALHNAMELDVNGCFRKRMKNWLGRIEEGQNITHAALHCGFDKTLGWAFDESVNKGNTTRILETLEEVYRSRYYYRMNLLNAIGCPLMVLGLGCCVGFVMVAMFLPMVKIIEIMLW